MSKGTQDTLLSGKTATNLSLFGSTATSTFTGIITTTDVTNTSSGSTGSIHTAGGLGVTKKIFSANLEVNDGTTALIKTAAGSTTIAPPVSGTIIVNSQNGGTVFQTSAADLTTVGNTGKSTTVQGSSVIIPSPLLLTSSVTFSAVNTLNIPLSIGFRESVDYRFALNLSGNGDIKIFRNTVTSLNDPKTSVATGALCLSGNAVDLLSYAPLNSQIQTFTITVTRDNDYYLFYMNGVLFFQTYTAAAATYAGYTAFSGTTSFSLTPSAGTMTGYYRKSTFTQ